MRRRRARERPFSSAASDLNGKIYRFHLNQGQTRHDALRSRLIQDALDIARVRFLVVELCQLCLGSSYVVLIGSDQANAGQCC
jgi:hypothetical protein